MEKKRGLQKKGWGLELENLRRQKEAQGQNNKIFRWKCQEAGPKKLKKGRRGGGRRLKNRFQGGREAERNNKPNSSLCVWDP